MRTLCICLMMICLSCDYSLRGSNTYMDLHNGKISRQDIEIDPANSNRVRRETAVDAILKEKVKEVKDAKKEVKDTKKEVKDAKKDESDNSDYTEESSESDNSDATTEEQSDDYDDTAEEESDESDNYDYTEEDYSSDVDLEEEYE